MVSKSLVFGAVLAVVITVGYSQNCHTQSDYTQYADIWRKSDFPPNITTQNFAEVPGITYMTTQAQLETTWIPLDQQSKLRSMYRPLGYKYTIVQAYNREMPCISVDGVAGFGVEINVYALDDVHFCITDLNGQQFNNQVPSRYTVCGNRKVRHCFIADSVLGTNNQPIQNMTFGIFIPPGEEVDYDVGFFYRLRHSQFSYNAVNRQFTTDNTEMWCAMVSGDAQQTGAEGQWPDFAQTTPDGFAVRQLSSAPHMSTLVCVLVAILSIIVA